MEPSNPSKKLDTQPENQTNTHPIKQTSDNSVNTAQTQYSPQNDGQVPETKKNRKKVWVILAVFLIITGILSYFLLFTNNSTKNSTNGNNSVVQKAPHLLLFNPVDGKYTLTDKNGKKIRETQGSLGSYPQLLAASPNGQFITSLYKSSDQTYSYTLIDKDGKQQKLNSTVSNDLINRHTTLLSNVIFTDENNILLGDCSAISNSADNNCKLIKINLLSGEENILLDTTVPQKYVTGESVFNIIGISSDQKNLYIEANGPSKLGDSNNAVYSFNLGNSSSAKVYDLPEGNLVSNLTMSQDSKKIVYDSQTSSSGAITGGTIDIVDIPTGKKSNLIWSKSASSGAYPYVWSQDNSKLSIVGNEWLTGGVSSIGPLTLAYIDVNSSSLKELLTIQDSAHKMVDKQYWVDDTNLIYELQSTTSDHNFTGATSEIFKQNIITKESTKMDTSTNRLLSIVWF